MLDEIIIYLAFIIPWIAILVGLCFAADILAGMFPDIE